MLVLTGWHGLSDYELELLAIDRLSFHHFLGYPEKIPDRSMIWTLKENMSGIIKPPSHLGWNSATIGRTR
jgi:hypothetical protein